MKRKFDFTLEEDNDLLMRTVFRFYPRRSHVHGFAQECPKKWEDVYKVYYCWAIIRQDKWDENDDWESEVMFDMSCDECSRFGDIPYAIDKIMEDMKDNYISVFGDGADWQLSYNEKCMGMEEDTIEFQVWDRVTHQGYKFCLYLSEAQKFKEYINMTQEYMLQHSQPI